MRRSHPPTLLKLVERTLREECGLERGSRLLLGVSGGPDSQALLSVLARLAPKLGLELRAHGVDHGLRPEAHAELELARALARRLDVPFGSTRVSVVPGGNVMARARAARYRALRAAASEWGGALVATAHHADDRAETVIERLLRGAGPRGLAVLPPRSGDLVRPMIRARRTDVQAHLGRHHLDFATDPTNADPRFLRARLRAEVLPLLQALSPRIVEHLNALADQLAGPEPPSVADETGASVRLGRAQAAQLRRLLESPGTSGSVRISGGRSIEVERGTPRLRPAQPLHRTTRGRKSD